MAAFVEARIRAAGGPVTPDEAMAAARSLARAQCVRYRWLTAGAGLLMLCGGVAGAAATVLLGAPLVGFPRILWSGPMIASVTIGLVGALFLSTSRSFAVHWDLATKGRAARAMVVNVEGGMNVRRGKRGPITMSVSTLRLAVELDGGEPYEVETVTVDQVHGYFAAGQALEVLVDPQNRLRVLAREGAPRGAVMRL